MQKRLSTIASNDNKEQKKVAYASLLQEIMSSESESNVKVFIEHISKQNALISRQVLQQFADLFKAKRKSKSGKNLVLVIEESINILSTESTSMMFDEVINSLRYNVGLVYFAEMEEADEDAFVKAAKHLGKINLDAGNPPYTPKQKYKILVTTAQLYLAEEMYREAEVFVNKISLSMQMAREIPEKYILQYLSANAQVQDANQKFIQAAFGYIRLSEKILNESERLEKLEKGLKCTILAPTGPNRSRLLAKFYKEEKSSKLTGFKLVEKMFMERFIVKSDYEEFEKTLSEHQMRLTREGWTTLQKAIIEHNLIAASKVYNNITLNDLAVILDVSAQAAESIASNMITQQRLVGTIDQGKGLLHFQSASVLQNWDNHIEIACNAVNSVYDSLLIQHPELKVV